MKKLLFPIILSSLLVISACNKSSNPSSDVSTGDTAPSTDTTPSTDTNPGTDTDTNTDTSPVGTNGFENLVRKLKTTHNYTMDVHSCLEDARADEIYDDVFENINDKAFYSKYYSGHTGLILQKNQGYVPFIQYANGVVEVQENFYSTNSNVGISSIYDLVAENLFIGEYVQDANDETLYYNTNFDAIAVGCNFTGYAETANLVAPEKLIAKYDATNEQIIVTVNYDVWFYDEGEQNPKGTATLTIRNIGSTTNPQVESYVENPTTTFNARTEWNDNDKSLFNRYFNGKVPAFLTGSTYALSVEQYSDYRGTYILVTDYASGDLRESYSNALISQNKFTKVNDNKYTLVEKNETLGVTTTYTVEMVFKSPNDKYNEEKTFGYYYPNGLFQLSYSVKSVENTVDSIDSLNKYIIDNKYNLLVPTLPFGSEVTKVSGFNDRTSAMNAEYGSNMYGFYTSTTGIKIYVESYAKAKEDFNKYAQALREYGYTEESSGLGLKYFRLADDENDSYVSMSDFNSITEANYSGYIQLRFNVYSSANGHTTPTKSEDSEIKLTSITLSDMTTNYSVGDTFSFDGVVTAHYSNSTTKVVTPTEVTTPDMSTSGYKTVIVTYTENGVTKDAEYTITVIGSSDTNNLLIDMTLVGGSIKLISPTTESYVEPGEMVKFVVKVEEGYELEKVFLKEDPNYTISVNPMGTNSFFFIMPEFKVTITATIKKVGGDSESSYVGVYRDVTNTESESKASIRAITLNEDGTGSYSYRNKTSFGDSTYVANFTWSVNNETISFVLTGFEDKITYKSFASYKMFLTGEIGETMSATITTSEIEIQLYDAVGYAKETTSIFEK